MDAGAINTSSIEPILSSPSPLVKPNSRNSTNHMQVPKACQTLHHPTQQTIKEEVSKQPLEQQQQFVIVEPSLSPPYNNIISMESFVQEDDDNVTTSSSSSSRSISLSPIGARSSKSSPSTSISSVQNLEELDSNLTNNAKKDHRTSRLFSKDKNHASFKKLESELTRFLSKTGVNKSNVLRLALLPFLRQDIGEFILVDSFEECSFRIKVLQKWWMSILSALRDKIHPVSGSDRPAYLEAISGIMSRSEWTQTTATTRYIYESLLYDTVKLIIDKLCLKTVPLSMAAFSGKVLAYSFFWAPGVAPVLLHLLRVSQLDIDRIVEATFTNDDVSLEDSVNLVSNNFPLHLAKLVGYTQGLQPRPTRKSSLGPSINTIKIRPNPPPQLPELYGPWARRWIMPSSDVFFAFLKHYYAIISKMLSVDLPWFVHLASPGLFVIQAFLVNQLDHIVRPPKPVIRPSINDFNTAAPIPLNSSSGGRRRVDQLKLLATVREILHNDKSSSQHYESFCKQFEHVLHAVAIKTSVYDVESCIVFADLVEEYLSSLILVHSLTRHRVEIQKDNVIDWEFWIQVVYRMLSSDNCHTELRALAFLFNIWDNIPIGKRERAGGNFGSELSGYLLANQGDGLRWSCTGWLLSIDMWKRYFCHWQPIVRAYYQRLVCWKIVSVGTDGDLLCSILFSNYISDARLLVRTRLNQSHAKIVVMINTAQESGNPIPYLEASPPVVNRKLSILNNPIAIENTASSRRESFSNGALTPSGLASLTSSTNSNQPRRVDAYDVFDDIAYSYPTSGELLPDSELATGMYPIGGVVSSTRTSEETVRKSARKVSSRRASVGASNAITPSTSLTFEAQQRRLTSSNSMTGLENFGNAIKKKWTKWLGSSGSSSSNIPDNGNQPSAVRRYSSGLSLSSMAKKLNNNSSSSDEEDSELSKNDSFILSADSESTLSDSSSSLSTPPSFTNTPDSSSSSMSTPPSPRSVRSFSSISRSASDMSLNITRGRSKLSREQRKLLYESSNDSLTMALIPPPEKLLRARPEITRPLFKFGLEYSERAARRQQQVIRNEIRRRSVGGPWTKPNRSETRLIKPRLPFVAASSNQDDEEFGDGYDSENNDDEEFYDEEQFAKILSPSEDDVKYWKYCGRSLSEWDETIVQFEEFVRSRRMMTGAMRIEDIGAPFMIAEIPSKALGA